MAAFVDYSTRDNGVLRYRGFEQVLMNDPDVIKMMNIFREVTERMLSPSVDLNELEPALRSNDIFRIASVLNYSIGSIQQHLNDLQLSSLNLRRKYSFISNNTLRKINNRDIIGEAITAIINRRKKSNPNRENACPGGYIVTVTWSQRAYDDCLFALTVAIGLGIGVGFLISGGILSVAFAGTVLTEGALYYLGTKFCEDSATTVKVECNKGSQKSVGQRIISNGLMT